MHFRFAYLLIALSLISCQMAQAAGGSETHAAPNAITRLPFGKVAPLPGALTLSADGLVAAHIGADGDVVIWDSVKIRSLEIIPAGGKTPGAVALSADGNLLSIGYSDSRVIVRSRLEKRMVHEFLSGAAGAFADSRPAAARSIPVRAPRLAF